MNIVLVIFDLAGTTVKDNQDVHRVLQQTLAAHGVTISLADANPVMGIPKPIAIRELLENHYAGNRLIDEVWIDEIHKEFVQNMILFYKTDPSVGEKEGVSKLFKKLKESKLKIAVDTGFDRLVTDALLERLGWQKDNLIDASVTSDEVLRGRPFPDMIYKAMELTQVTDSATVAKVGDTASDLQEGSAAGCRYVIGVTTGAFSKEELERETHTHLVETVDEVLQIVSPVVD